MKLHCCNSQSWMQQNWGVGYQQARYQQALYNRLVPSYQSPYQPQASYPSQTLYSSQTVAATNTYLKYRPVAHSRYPENINAYPGRLAGFNREANGALPVVKDAVKDIILQESAHLTRFDQAMLLAIAEHESGFNPDAAAKESSAGGVFQIINGTAQKLGLPLNQVFEARQNIQAGIKLYQENLRLVANRYSHLSGAKKAAMLYALHHDGPSLKYGGWDIAKAKVVPKFQRYFEGLMGQG